MTPFLKMNGLGNEFAIIDVRGGAPMPASADIAALSDRTTGIGFDQFIAIAPPPEGDGAASATMRIVNADGGEVESCGNAARCVVRLLLEETGRDVIHLASKGGPMAGWADGDGIAIDMGEPRFRADQIPLSDGAGDPQHLIVPGFEAFGPAACCNVGNPHAIFFVPDAASVPLETAGPALEHHALFPERANITFATVRHPRDVTVRVWERGVGATRACGTAACATLAVGHKLGHLADEACVRLPGGALQMSLREGRIVMRGPTSLEWRGTIDGSRFARDDEPQRPASRLRP